jgi:hypothetical protein
VPHRHAHLFGVADIAGADGQSNATALTARSLGQGEAEQVHQRPVDSDVAAHRLTRIVLWGETDIFASVKELDVALVQVG